MASLTTLRRSIRMIHYMNLHDSSSYNCIHLQETSHTAANVH
jgi:hypothetical protein